MTRLPLFVPVIAWLLSGGVLSAEGFKHIGDFMVKSRTKMTGDKATNVPIKPLLLKAYTDGVEIRLEIPGNEEARTTFPIYRSDGIGRQRTPGAALEIIPGLQGSSTRGGELSHLRISRESLTITTFPAVSDQTVITYAIGVEQTPATPGSAETKGTAPKPVEAPAAPVPAVKPESPATGPTTATASGKVLSTPAPTTSR